MTSCYRSAVPANIVSPEVFNELNTTVSNSTDPLWSLSMGRGNENGTSRFGFSLGAGVTLLALRSSTIWTLGHWERTVFLPAPLEPSAPPSGSGGGVSHGRTGAGSVPVSKVDNGSKNAPLSLTRGLLGYAVPKRVFRQSQSTANISTSAPASTPPRRQALRLQSISPRRLRALVASKRR